MLNIVVHGLGNLGKYAIEALESAPDMECIGVIRRKSSLGRNTIELRDIKDYESVESLMEKTGIKPDAAILCTPSRNVYNDAPAYLNQGICTVDSFDIHDEINKLLKTLEEPSKKGRAASISAAGWDPGTDSILRTYLEAMAPHGSTFTNFGRGRSMGHSVAARATEGVKDAVSITIPMGGGMHSRVVYVVIQNGYSLETVTANLKADNYFAHDSLRVIQVADEAALSTVADTSHGVLIERTGGFGSVSNQQFRFDMRINNPALTSQILVASARAVVKMQQGVWTLIDVPPIYLLPGKRESLIHRLV